MGKVKKCTRCGNTAAHHHELDVICMQCEMAQCYPGDPEMTALVGVMETNTELLEDIDKLEASIKKVKPIKKLIDWNYYALLVIILTVIGGLFIVLTKIV